MSYLLDTCALSDYLKGDLTTVQRLKQEKPHNIFLSAITRFEIDYGLLLKPNLNKILAPQLEAIYSRVGTINFSIDEARQAAIVRANLKERGALIGFYDLLIAGTALAHDLVVVTSNEKEFSRVEGLNIENWR